jgi:uncharacterized protein (TIGR03437 family)
VNLSRRKETIGRLALLLGLAAATATSVPAAVIVTLSANPNSVSSSGTSNLQALVTGATTTAAVTWSISPAGVGVLGPGTAPNAGGISTNTYAAPPLITSKLTVTITVTSKEDPAQSASTTLTLNPIPVSVTVTPATFTMTAGQSRQFAAAVTGTSVTGVTWSISPPGFGSIDQNGLYQAPPVVNADQTVTVTATSVFETAVTGTASVTVQAVGVTVTPATVSLANNQTQRFTATVVGSSNSAVNWSIVPQTGTIDNTGLYTAPATITGSPKVTVTATSAADSSKSGTATITLSTSIDIGTGAPTTLMQLEFQAAFYRNGFNSLVSLPPLAQVVRLGPTGYVQRFADAAKTSGVTFALATVSATAPASAPPVVQLYSGVYAYFTTVGVTTAGYPTMDTQPCPGQTNPCTYDFFDKGYALFVYPTALPTGQNFTVRLGFYTEWTALGGVAGLGAPVDVETAITASTANTATQQVFAGGAIYSITSGANRTKAFGVLEPIYDLYLSSGGPAGSLGLPAGDEFVLASGVHRQLFEGGALEYTPGSDPVLRPPVASVVLSGAAAAGITLPLGSTLTVTATPYTAAGAPLSNRPISWSTSNGSVIAIQANSGTALLRAIGGGSAKVTAVSEGIVSAALTVLVTAPCCQVGDGAPASVQQSFQTALARDQVVVQVPVSAPATRVGSGYIQMLQSADPNAPVVYMLAKSDSVGTAFLVSGAVLAYYLAAGGPAGPLGYPLGDVSAGGTQLFLNGAALAGNPVRLVSGAVLTKWALLGLEAGTAGPPVADATAYSTFGANAGLTQAFANGAIFAASAGPLAGQAYFVTGLILARYNAIGGAGGDFGMPVSDEFVSGSLHRQNFEGGSITYSAGDTVAQSQPAAKVPGVVAPPSISAGGRARLAVVGFANNSTIRVSVTGEPDFLVTTANGAYSWDMFIPLTAASGTVTIHAADTHGPSAADGALLIKGFTDNRISIAKTGGDLQTGSPGAQLPLALTVSLLDSSGAPVPGVPVAFQGSSGVQLSTGFVLTDSAGQAQTLVRLPNTEGLALVTVNAPSVARSPVTFSLTAAAFSLNNFPAMQQSGSATLGNGTATIAQKGALLTAFAAILRYRQNRGELPAPNGLADPGTLNQFLKSFCVTDSKGNAVCDGYLSNPDSGEQVVNLWRAANFTGGVDLAVDPAATASIADRVAQGVPLLLSLGLSLNGTPMGGHFVVATGVASDGSIVIQDPNPIFARTSLSDYLSGFAGTGGTWKGTLLGVVELVLRSPSATRFLLAAISQPPPVMQSLALSATSSLGACGNALDLWDAVDSSGKAAAGGLISRMVVCDGSQAAYQLRVGAASPFKAFVTDLASAGGTTDLSASTPGDYQATRPLLPLVVAPLTALIASGAVLNGATFTGGIAPGGVMSIFGSGLSGPGLTTAVDIDGTGAIVLFASPFQVNAQVPASVTPGPHTLNLRSAYGAAQQAVTVSAVAPAIFLVGTPPVGAVTNQDGSLNSPVNPLPRGQALVIYITGLGTVVKQGPYSVTTAPVTVLLNGSEYPAAFAGLTPGYFGLYQVNVVFPAITPPGLGVSLSVKQAGQSSNTVFVSLQ